MLKLFKTAKAVCVILVLALVMTIVAPVGAFTAAAAVTDPVSDSSQWNNVVDGWYTSFDGCFKFCVGDWLYYGFYGKTLVSGYSLPTDSCSVSIYEAESDETFANKTADDMQKTLNESVVKLERMAAGNSDLLMYYCQSASYEYYVFQAYGNSYVINFIYGGSGGKTRAEFADVTSDMMQTLIVSGYDSDGLTYNPFAEGVKSVTHSFEGNNVVFTVTTGNGAYEKVRVTTGDGDIAVSDKYTVNADGDYVWTVEVDACRSSERYLFDLFSFKTGDYLNLGYEYTIRFDFTYAIKDGEAIITKYTGGGGNVLIPTVIDGYPVTTIGESAFDRCDTLVSISMPSVTTIEEWAFFECESLVSVNMPSVTTIESWAFSGCIALANVDIPNVTVINPEVFYHCDSLKSVYLPNVTEVDYLGFAFSGVVSVDAPKLIYAESESFKGCKDLESFNAPLLSFVGWEAFRGCSSLTDIDLSNIITICESSFAYCTSLTSVDLPSATNIETSAFEGCTSLKSVSIPKLEDVYNLIFSGCTSLETVNIPNTQYIGSEAFYGCTSLKRIELPRLDFIGVSAFEGCTALEQVIIPRVDDIRSDAFKQCESVTLYAASDSYVHQFALDNNIAFSPMEFERIKSVTHTIYEDKIIFTIITSAGNYGGMRVMEAQYADAYKDYDDNFGLGFAESYTVDADGDYVWTITLDVPSKKSDYVFEVYLPELGGYIHSYYYYEVDLGFSYKIIDGTETIRIFLYTGDSKDVVIPSAIGGYAVALIERDTFLYRGDIERVTIYADALIEKRAFYNCDLLREVNILGNATLESGAFYGCSALENVNMPNVEVIPYGLFAYLENLTSVDVSGVVTIGESAFEGCISLVSVDLPSLTDIHKYAFGGCVSLEKLSIPRVTSIRGTADEVFYDCDKLVLYAPRNSRAHQYAIDNNVAFVDTAMTILAVTHEFVDGKLVFTVTTDSGKGDRIKVTTADDLKGSLAVSDKYTVNAEGNYVWTIKVDAPDADTIYAFDVRSSETAKYSKEYYCHQAQVVTIVKAVSCQIVDGKITFTVITSPGNYNRIKITTADNLKGSLVTINSYTINEDGDYVWTVKTTAPGETTNYAFDIRSSETGKYLKEYAYCEAEVAELVKSISCDVVNSKIVFTVVSTSGDYNRIKITTADNLKGSLATVSSYVINEDGDYVWTIKIDLPEETTNYAFDLRFSETNKYVKDYYYYEYVIEETIKSVTYREVAGGRILFTVVTNPGDFNRLRCGSSESVVDNIANSSTYTVNADGEYVWTIAIAKPAESMDLYFDLRDSATNKFIKEFYVFSYVA